MPHIVVTGGSGRLGQVVIADLLAHRYDVLNVDRVPPPQRLARSLQVELDEDALAGKIWEGTWETPQVRHADGSVADW